MYTLLQELKDTGAQTPAVGMLVEPLLPRALRREVDKQKTLKGDVVTDLYAIGIGEQHLAHSCSEEGTVVDDGFVVPEGPRMAKQCIKMQEISDALELVPVSQRDCVEYAVALVLQAAGTMARETLNKLQPAKQAVHFLQGSQTPHDVDQLVQIMFVHDHQGDKQSRHRIVDIHVNYIIVCR